MKMENLSQKPVGEIVAEDYRTATVFKKYGIDFCCGGNKTLEMVAAARNIDIDHLNQDLHSVAAVDNEEQQNYDEWPLVSLVDYIVNKHHGYCRTTLPEITFYGKKVMKVHGENHPELEEIYQELVKLYTEMLEHLDKEESHLFPFITALEAGKENQLTVDKPASSFVADPIAMMEEEHDEAGETMAKIRKLSNNFTPPGDACATYQLLYKNLEAFEEDLHKHVHLENNILFPKALKLEHQLTANN